MSENTAPDEAPDDGPELRRLLEKIHGDSASVFDHDLDDESEHEANVDSGHPIESVDLDKKKTKVDTDIDLHLPREPAADEPLANYDVPTAKVNERPETVAHEASPAQVPDNFLYTPTSLELSPDAEAIDLEKKKNAEPLYIKPPEHLRHELQSLPVILDCSLKSLHKTLGEVSRLQEGEIILLGCGPDTSIELKANGRVFAQGRLVMVDDQLAVEVMKKLE